MKKIRFVKHWTVNTDSDHHALFVHVQIRRRKKGEWKDLLIVSCNMGGRFGEDDWRELLEKARKTEMPFILCFQEGSDQGWLKNAAERAGLRYLGGSGQDGQSATPMVLHPKIDVVKSAWQRILATIWIGSGAGPERNKDKWWTRTRLKLDGVPFGASSWHVVPSHYNARRLWAAKKMAAPVFNAIDRFRRPFFIAGDINSDDDEKFSAWLRVEGLTTNHRELKEIPTLRNRSIDVVACKKALVA